MLRKLASLTHSRLQKYLITSFLAFFAIAICSTFLVTSVNAQVKNYPQEVKRQIVRDCIRQPLPYVFNEEFNRIVKPRYCSCYANYLEANLSYNSFKVIDNAIRKDPSSIERLKPKYKNILETAFTSCYNKVCNRVGRDKCPTR